MACARRLSRPILWLLIAALLGVKALVPAGWMPEARGDGIRIALCTGAGPAVALLDSNGRIHKDGSGDNSRRDICPFGTLAAAADLPGLPALALPPAPEAQPHTPLWADTAIPLPFSPRPPARGPPLLA